MLFVVYNIDASGKSQRRADLLPAHRDYMKSLGGNVLCGGPLLADDGKSKRGGMYVLRAESAEEARAIAANDPFVKGGVFRSSDVSAWRWQSGPDSLQKQN